MLFALLPCRLRALSREVEATKAGKIALVEIDPDTPWFRELRRDIHKGKDA